MSLQLGIVGLPNVGKSTLFNAITNSDIQAENFPFCTIEPNVGLVAVPDDRLQELSKISNSEKCIPTHIEFTDIAGLVKGASKGEGLGNQFLSHIRSVSAIVHVLRCFDDDNIVHVEGKVNPIEDLDIIMSELILSDLEQLENTLVKQQKKAKANKDEEKLLKALQSLVPILQEGTPLNQAQLSEETLALIKNYQFLSLKPSLFVANVREEEVATNKNHWIDKITDYTNSAPIVICAELENQLASLSESEKKEYLNELGLDNSGLDKLAKASYSLLGLHSYLTTGKKETRAWTLPVGAKAPEAAGVIHSDFEKGFIRANVVSFDNFITCNGWQTAKEKGLCKQEGKDYIVQDGDVIEFLFNV